MRYAINADGSISNTADWDAGAVLSAQSARTVLTYKAGSLIAFNSTNLTPTDFAVTTTTKESLIVNFILNGETSQDVTNWKLGDIFHSSPMAIGTPNSAFYDQWDQSNPQAFTTFLNNNIRTTSNGKGRILVGDNDGQLHAFRMGAAGAGGGSEAWSFIPPNLLSQLANIAHNTHPTSLIHTYFVDGPLSAADVWLGTGGTINTTYKSASDWYTYFIMSEGRGGNLTLWSSATDCESGFSSKYSSTYTNYCGYYAFDVTNTLNNPVYKWRLGGNSGLSATDGAYLGQPWSKMYIGRVLINNTEKWVGLIGGGYSGVNCPATGTCDTRGKGFYVVDLSNGSILWRYTNSNNGSMKFDLAAGPVAVDYDNDGFLDTAYIGDLGGNVWRFKFCLASNGTSCNTANWSGGLLFSNSSTNQKIFSSVAVTIDQSNNLWVYFGTGDSTDPTVFNATNDSFYAIKDNDRSTTYTISNLVNITSTTYTDSSTGHGWYINLASGEKVLSAPNVNFQNIYFTTFTPPNPNDPCDQSGNAQLYIINYITGAGTFANNVRSETIGIGIPNSPIVSRNPYGGTDIYVSSSQVQSGSGSHTQKETDPTVWAYPPNNLIYWRDTRLQ
jgi:type IV pilus assembly protein PilY1